MTDAELGWCGGLVDGEGCIGISRPPITQPFMTITMSHEPTIRRFHKLVRTGSVSFRVETRKDWKSCWSWVAYSSQAITVVRELQPYIFTKSEQAKLLLEYSEKCYRGKGTKKVPDEIAVLREIIWEEMAALNKKGKS